MLAISCDVRGNMQVLGPTRCPSSCAPSAISRHEQHLTRGPQPTIHLPTSHLPDVTVLPQAKPCKPTAYGVLDYSFISHPCLTPCRLPTALHATVPSDRRAPGCELGVRPPLAHQASGQGGQRRVLRARGGPPVGRGGRQRNQRNRRQRNRRQRCGESGTL